MANRITSESWEKFDAEGMFPPPQMHTNRVTKVDKKEMTKVDAPEGQNGASGNSNGQLEDGDTYSDSPVDKNHVDDMFEMEGLDSNSTDDREVKADKEVDERTQEPEPTEANKAEDGKGETNDEPSPGEQQPQENNTDSEKGDGPAASEDAQGQPSESEQSEPIEQEGAEQPIQKESEGIEEVAEATSKTSEDVHGGDEATKDIEDSPNAADDGQNPDNKGAESGEGGEEGEGDGSGEAKGEVSGNPLASEDDWEAKADHSATALKLLDDLREVEAKARDEKGHRTSLPSYNFNRETSPAELEIAFKKASELLKKFAAEEEITARKDGEARWDVKQIVRSVVSYRHQRIPSNKYEHPKEADICILLDISGSCAQQAEMFMAIAAGSIGSGVRVFVGYNGSCRAIAMDQPKRKIRSYAKAKPWVQAEVERVSGWHNAETIGEWSFDQFLDEAAPKTVIVFGDWDGVDQYTSAVQNKKHRDIKFFWFANEGHRGGGNTIPAGFTQKNYVPGIFTPRDFVKALRKLK